MAESLCVLQMGPFTDLDELRRQISMRSYRVLNMCAGRYLTLEEIGMSQPPKTA